MPRVVRRRIKLRRRIRLGLSLSQHRRARVPRLRLRSQKGEPPGPSRKMALAVLRRKRVPPGVSQKAGPRRALPVSSQREGRKRVPRLRAVRLALSQTPRALLRTQRRLLAYARRARMERVQARLAQGQRVAQGRVRVRLALEQQVRRLQLRLGKHPPLRPTNKLAVRGPRKRLRLGR